MRAAKMKCASAKKPIALKKGGNPVAKGLSDPKFKPQVVKPKKGKGSYTRKGKSLPFSMCLFLLNKNIDSQGLQQR